MTVPPITLSLATLYVLSGVIQPLLVTVASAAGLADPTCQLYMFFYYLGPAIVLFTVCHGDEGSHSWGTLRKIGSIAMVDVVSQTMNYTGSAMAGPTIFAIIYSSVTVWCAILSRVLLGRQMSTSQWLSVGTVFGGLSIAGVGAVSLGERVFHGAVLITFGSALHALMYVWSEAVMKKDRVSARKYCAVYNTSACAVYILWQLFYTRRHFDDLVLGPMQAAGTSLSMAAAILSAIALISMVHSLTFFHTVKFFPGGATSAGAMKALQAVLVFLATWWIFCGHIGGEEMCFTGNKFLSLIVVCSGLLWYGKSTEEMESRGGGYRRVDSALLAELG